MRQGADAHQLIDTTDALEAVVESMASAEELALDVEGDGLFRYRARLCTLQLATKDEIAIIDTLALSDLAPLGRLLSATGPVKVVHDASFDVRLLGEVGLPFERLFDTSVAARFLGDPATGLAAMLETQMGLTVSKAQQHSDWGRRPLGEHDVAYLEGDVKHLLQLAEILRQRIADAAIEQEVAEECAYLLWKASTDEPDPRPPWIRIKGWESLPATGRAVLREVALVRERAARDMDVPPFKVVGNETLLALARSRPRSQAEASRVRGLSRGRARRILRDLLRAVRLGEEAGDVPAEERSLGRPKPPPPEERDAQKKRQKAINRWRKRVAGERKVDVQIVLPGHCVSDLARRGASDLEALRQIPGIGEFRVERYGPALVALLS